MRAWNPTSLQRNVKPTRSMSERAASVVCMMETAFGPPRGLGVRTKRHVPALVAAGYGALSSIEPGFLEGAHSGGLICG
jgi:hypothetical protein